MTQKQTTSLDDLRRFWEQPSPTPGCQAGECPQARTVHIQAESITITNLIFAGDLTPELSEALKAARA